MTDELHGHVASIATTYHGATLVADAATGATTLLVNDVAQFAEEGGSLRIAQDDGTFLPAIDYTAIDDDASSITLATPTTADVFAGGAVRVLDANGSYVVDVEATVVDDNTGSVATIDVHHSLIRLLTNSVRAGVDESVVATRDESGAWEVTRVLGKTPTLDAPHAQCGQSGATIADSTPTTLVYNSSSARGGVTLASGVITVPSDGRYVITANVSWDASSTGYRRVWLQRNGTATGAEVLAQVAAASVNTSQSLSQILDLLAGDAINVEVSQNSGANRTITGTVAITGLD